MAYPLRSTVGVAVMAGALVFSGTAANAQSAAADETLVAAPIEQGTPDAVESTPVVEQGDAPLPPATPVSGTFGNETAGNGGSADSGAGIPEAVTPSDAPADTNEQPSTDSVDAAGATPPATEVLPAGSAATPGTETPAGTPAEIPAGAPAAKLPLTAETAPLTGTGAPAVLPPAEQVSRPAITVVPAPAAQDTAKAAAKEAKEKTGANAKAAAPLPDPGKFEFPEGAADWTDEQWNNWTGTDESGKWLEDNAESLGQLMESKEFAGFRDSIFPYFVDGNPEGLFAYLKDAYPNDPLMAQFMVGLVMGQLMGEGLLDENGNFIGEFRPETEEPAEKPDKEPSKETTEKPVIEPAGNMTKPKASTTRPVEIFTPVKVPARKLAETGAEGIGLLAGTGGGLLALGVGALVLRRRKQA